MIKRGNREWNDEEKVDKCEGMCEMGREGKGREG